MSGSIIRQGFRTYGIVLVIAAAWTIAWITTGMVGTFQAIGTAWIGVATLGIVLLIGLLETHDEVFTIDEERREKFTSSPLTGTPLNLYLGGLFGWALISVGWLALDAAVLSNVMIAYGWFGLAGFGSAISLGMCVTHADTLVETIPSSSLSGLE